MTFSLFHRRCHYLSFITPPLFAICAYYARRGVDMPFPSSAEATPQAASATAARRPPPEALLLMFD